MEESSSLTVVKLIIKNNLITQDIIYLGFFYIDVITIFCIFIIISI